MHQQLGSLVGATVGGVLGTAFMEQGMKLQGKLPESLRPAPPRQDPAEYILDQLESRRGRPLSPTAHRRVSQGLHWAYGIGWSGLLGLLGPRLGMNRPGRAAIAGAALGAGVWAAGYLGWLRGADLVPPVKDRGVGGMLSNLLTHVGYGLVAALPIHVANRVACQRR